MQKKVVVIGGVAGGASAAARLRRLDEFAQITIIERGPDVSFANCGLPYYVGGEIKEREVLAIQNPQSLKAMLDLDVRVRHEATSINREEKTVEVKNLDSGEILTLPYDKLILSPGAAPFIPPIAGIQHPSIFTLRNLVDMDKIVNKVAEAKSALVVGAGFIGLEMAEQLQHLGLDVSLVELQDQVLPQMDKEMVQPIQNALQQNGINLQLSDGVSEFEDANGAIQATLQSGDKITVDCVILSIGVRPENQLAVDSGLAMGQRGHIQVNEYMQTSAPDIYASGDAVESFCAITGEPSNLPLGGPANRQGRIVADHINNPSKTLPYPGSIGTSIVRAFDVTAGITGLNEKRLKQLGLSYTKALVSDWHHASYYPGATALSVKVLHCPDTGKIYGGQVFGAEGVDKRLDILATAIRGKMTMQDLEHLELAYAPPFGSAKDPLNTVACNARNQKDDWLKVLHELPEGEDYQLIDVRPVPMAAGNPIEGAIHIPLPELRSRLNEIDKTKPVITICRFGKLSYFAARALEQRGYNVKSISAGISIQNT